MSAKIRANDDEIQRTIFSISGSHFVDIYYNHVYASSIKSLPRGSSVQTEYARQVQAYIIGVKNDKKIYRAVVANLHKYFGYSFDGLPSRFGMLTFGEFVDLYVKQFVPETYFELMSSDEKDEILSTVICTLVAGLGAYMTTTDLLIRTIDHHDERAQETIRMAQAQSLKIQQGSRIEIENHFLRRSGQVRESIPPENLARIREKFRNLVKSSIHQANTIKELEATVAELEQTIEQLRANDAKSRKLINMLRNERNMGVLGAAGAHYNSRAQDYGIGERPPPPPNQPAKGHPMPHLTPGLDLIGEPGSLAVAPAAPAVRSSRPEGFFAPPPAQMAAPSGGFFAPPNNGFFATPAPLGAASSAAPAGRRTNRGKMAQKHRKGRSSHKDAASDPDEDVGLSDLVESVHPEDDDNDDDGQSGSGESNESDGE